MLELRVERVANGWVVMGWSSVYGRKDGFCPTGTYVATSPEMLADLMRQWARDQVNQPSEAA